MFEHETCVYYVKLTQYLHLWSTNENLVLWFQKMFVTLNILHDVKQAHKLLFNVFLYF